MRTKTIRPAAVLALLAVSAAGLNGCTGSGKTGANAQASPSGAHGAALPEGVVNATGVPTAVPNDSALRKHVTITSCAAANDGWQASGTAKNPGDKRAKYTVTVFFTTTGGTVIGTGQSEVAVKAGGEEQWAIASTFKAPPDTRCVLRGVG
jgi:hypothetical protein